MTARPWMKFYPADWQADQALRSVGLEARCLWIECMCIMHRAEPYGHLVVHGHPVTDTQLAVLAGAPPDRVPVLMTELATAGVSSRNRAGVIYSRRMTRDEKRTKVAQKNGAEGGNPALSKTNGRDKPEIIGSNGGDNGDLAMPLSGCPPSDNPPWVNPEDNPKVQEGVNTQKPESRVEEEKRGTLAGACHPQAVADLMLLIWSEECRGILKIPIKLTPERVRACLLRWKDTFAGEAEQWRSHCQAILASPFLRGEAAGGWRADFDWALGPKNILKLQEGKYDGAVRQSGTNSKPSPVDTLREGAARAAAAHILRGRGGGDLGDDIPLAKPFLDRR